MPVPSRRISELEAAARPLQGDAIHGHLPLHRDMSIVSLRSNSRRHEQLTGSVVQAWSGAL